MGVHDVPKNWAGEREKGRTVVDRGFRRNVARKKRAMKTTEHGIEDSKDVENMHHMRLMALLQEQVRDKGFKSAARVLGKELRRRVAAVEGETGALKRSDAQGTGAGPSPRRRPVRRRVAGSPRRGVSTPTS